MANQFLQVELIEGKFYVSKADSNEQTQMDSSKFAERILGGPFDREDHAKEWVNQQSERPNSFHIWQHSKEYASQT
jgi:DNA-binding SARP family transcriptional activator